ncbi:hypothetical protein WJX79_005621 [Trebouxia sp. C0005]
MESGYDFEPDPTNGFGAIYFPGSMTEMGVQCWRSIFGSGWTGQGEEESLHSCGGCSHSGACIATQVAVSTEMHTPRHWEPLLVGLPSVIWTDRKTPLDHTKCAPGLSMAAIAEQRWSLSSRVYTSVSLKCSCGSMRGIMGLSFKAASKAAHYAL